MGTLYIVSTPIGNLKDITLRAIEILLTVDYIACEDTRRTGLLLQSLRHPERSRGISLIPTLVNEIPPRASLGRNDNKSKPILLSYYEQNEAQRTPQIIDLLKNGNDVALVSDSGTPAISDPGFKLVRECIVQGIKAESIPGPSSVLAALIVSGLPTDKFLFLGYLPRKGGHRRRFLAQLATILPSIVVTVIIFEAPHRLIKTLEELREVFGDISIVICRELTKVHEEVRREKISQSIGHFKKITPRGEFVLLFHL